jgi:hypothetical protein
MNQLSFLLEEHPVNHSQSQASEKDLQTLVATWPLSILGLLTAFSPSGSFGKTSLASCHRAEDGILVPSLGRWQKSGMGSPTECWTLSSSEWPSDAVVCSLSDILEIGDLPQRFYLTPKACAGILRRAEKRGKTLPEALATALLAVSQPEK